MKTLITILFVTLASTFGFSQTNNDKNGSSEKALITDKPVKKDIDTSKIDLSIKIDDIRALDYPELQVVPRASERLYMEAAIERERNIFMLTPFVISSLTTLVAGATVTRSLRPELTEEDVRNTNQSANLAMGVGTVGLGFAYWFTNFNNYTTSEQQIKAIKGKDKRNELLRERLAEETFERTAEQMLKWKWIYTAANFIACASITGKSTGNANLVPLIGLLTATLPLVFTTSYELNYEKQMDYKKRIYSPVTFFDYQYDSKNYSWTPQLKALWTF